jgi:hypothetical protein
MRKRPTTLAPGKHSYSRYTVYSLDRADCKLIEQYRHRVTLEVMGIIGKSAFAYLSDSQKLQRYHILPKRRQEARKGSETSILMTSRIESLTSEKQDQAELHQSRRKETGRIATKTTKHGKQPKLGELRSSRWVLISLKGFELTLGDRNAGEG